MKKNQIVAAVCLIAAVVCGILAVKGYVTEKQAGSSYEDLRALVTSEIDASVETGQEEDLQAGGLTAKKLLRPHQWGMQAESLQKMRNTMFAEKAFDDAENETKPAEVVSVTETADNPINFEKLLELCPDAYAWIRVPGTQIDYPIVQSPTDNTFYLNHNAQGEYEFAGAIFTEDYNSRNFQDPNTVIYGHNMNNGSMFEELHKFEDRTFFDEHPEFVIYTPNAVLHYAIFAAYTYDNRHILKEFDFSDSDVFRLYLQDILGQRSMGANIREDVSVSADDRIVTLSTCNGINEQRYLVQGVLLST